MTTTAQTPSASEQGGYVPNLAVLASMAAIEIDRRINQRPTPFESVHRLARELRSHVVPPVGCRGLLLDPASAELLSEALISTVDADLRQMPELANKANEVVALLEKPEFTHRAAELPALRDFCLALSRSALAQLAAERPAMPEHPFRR